MLEQLINLVKEHAGNAIINNNDVPNEKNEAVINTTAGGIMDHLKNLMANGGIDNITDLLKGGTSAGGNVVSGMSSSIAKTISEKFGIDQSKAENIMAGLIPVVMNSLSKKTNDPNDSSFNLPDILGSLTGGSGNSGGIIDRIKNMF